MADERRGIGKTSEMNKASYEKLDRAKLRFLEHFRRRAKLANETLAELEKRYVEWRQETEDYRDACERSGVGANETGPADGHSVPNR
jgi:hypothetical protein